MDRSNFKIYFGLILALIVVLILILIVSYINRQRQTNMPPSDNLSPTVSISNPEMSPPEDISPSLIHPTGFTGVYEEELPENLKNLSEQKQILKTKVPLSEAEFDIDFDYGEDKFKVNLSEPKDQSRIKFESWLKSNYPAIPLNRFIIN